MVFIQTPFLTSAPGKVIIFGEHAAVYNKPAIAAALSLRTYLLVSASENEDFVSLEFPDIDFKHSWKRSDLPWYLVRGVNTGVNNNNDSNNIGVGGTSSIGKERPCPTGEISPELVDGLAKCLVDIKSTAHYSAAHAFLYLYLNLCFEDTKGLTFCVRSTLPIGAGLGSSASIIVCISSALALIGGHVNPAILSKDELNPGENSDCQFIDSWSLMGEKCTHGTPSGIDNACASHGGAVMFQRKGGSLPSVRTSMRNFPSLNLLLTNTKIPRRTAVLVGNVSRLTQEYPNAINSILDSIEHVTREAYSIMIKPFNEESKENLRELIRINQGLLISLGVSHPALDKVKLLTDELEVGATKLTGAGGGGCAITLLNDDVDKLKMTRLIEDLTKEGFETFQTTLGGKGVGMLTPSNDEEIKKFSNVENFINLKSRDEIEDYVGVEKLHGWKFW
ncbi:hypothetical protein PACTADRAFT_49992 [Pachysolen tannophilus NRRL Y-2460]|uniref:Mevalonate kinase n=1 Tax=Pachysolen tannophilus NRRL Y-2460 TaxID=669874 RepID=A0A1E4TTW4_PACTA|nr:hypothetical protein PACTADRAFT_49992 [Pachysolen tannophilus NRRL Y-2460]